MRTNRILACALLVLARAALADVWIATEKAIHKLDPAAPRIVLSLPADHVKALAVDPRDNAVWVLAEKRVARYSSTGAPTADVDLKSLGLEGAKLLAIDARDGSVWIGDGDGGGHDGTKVLLRLDSTGAKAGTVPSPGDARSLAVALDGSVWVLGKKRALHFTSAGSPAGRYRSQTACRGRTEALAGRFHRCLALGFRREAAHPDRSRYALRSRAVRVASKATRVIGVGRNSWRPLVPVGKSARIDRRGRIGWTSHRPECPRHSQFPGDRLRSQFAHRPGGPQGGIEPLPPRRRAGRICAERAAHRGHRCFAARPRDIALLGFTVPWGDCQ